MSKNCLSLPSLTICLVSVLAVTACQQTEQIATQTQAQAESDNDSNSDPLVGCYTVSKSEPAQIKISKSDEQYAMQMRQFNNPNKDWDTPEPMQVLANDSREIGKYFAINAGESKFLEKVIARPDRVFVLAKITDSFASLNPQFDSAYLGYIYKGSNTVYKVSCKQTTQL